MILLAAVSQEYSSKAEDEYVIHGNDVLVKCKIPSFVADFVSVSGWVSSDGEALGIDVSTGTSMKTL